MDFWGNNDTLVKLSLLLICYCQQTCDVKIARVPARTRNVAEHLIHVIEQCKVYYRTKLFGVDKSVKNDEDAFQLLLGFAYFNKYPNTELLSWQTTRDYCVFPWTKSSYESYKRYIKYEDTHAYPTNKNMFHKIYDCEWGRKAEGQKFHFFAFYGNKMYPDFFFTMDENMPKFLERYFTFPGLVTTIDDAGDHGSEFSVHDNFIRITQSHFATTLSKFRKLLAKVVDRDEGI